MAHVVSRVPVCQSTCNLKLRSCNTEGEFVCLCMQVHACMHAAEVSLQVIETVCNVDAHNAICGLWLHRDVCSY